MPCTMLSAECLRPRSTNEFTRENPVVEKNKWIIKHELTGWILHIRARLIRNKEGYVEKYNPKNYLWIDHYDEYEYYPATFYNEEDAENLLKTIGSEMHTPYDDPKNRLKPNEKDEAKKHRFQIIKLTSSATFTAVYDTKNDWYMQIP